MTENYQLPTTNYQLLHPFTPSNEFSLKFDIAIRASQGARRAQEDCALVWPRGTSRDDSETLIALPAAVPGTMAAVLCDGMGGHAGGAMASRLACEHFLPALTDGTEPLATRLMAALDTANTAIAQKAEDSPAHAGMGSTLVGVHVDKSGLSWISVGDSLLYLIRQGALMTLNADHSLAPEIDKLASSGKISWEAARNDPRRHYLRSALTGEDIEMIDLSERPMSLRDGDVVVLSSDGIHTLETEAIARLIADIDPPDAATIAERLIDAVDDVGVPHQDNTTVIVLCLRGSTGHV